MRQQIFYCGTSVAANQKITLSLSAFQKVFIDVQQ